MDSFYDQPRKAPVSRTTPVSAHQDLNNLIPDASMLVHNHGIAPQNPNVMSYNAWRMHNKVMAGPNTFNKENITSNSTTIPIGNQPSICRKQVRFESPQVLNTITPNRPIMSPSNTRQDILKSCNPKKGTLNPILQPKPFEKMYMANIPNRILDLSIIEQPPMNKNKVDSHFRVDPSRNNQAECNLVKTVQNFQTRECPRPQFIPKKLHSAESTTIEPKPNEKDEPTVKDLLKIIQQQNEQLMCLQKQVTTLLQDRNDNMQRQIQPNFEQLNRVKSKPIDQKNGLPKFAIDVMTSFEVSIRPPNNFNNNKKFNNTAKIHEIIEDKNNGDERPNSLENSYKPTDVSLRLDEPVVVQEEYPSPDNSIHVDMQDFSSESEDEEKSSLLGWTIYNNVMDQVNCLLLKSQDEITQSNPMGKGNVTTMRKVKEATIRHLKNVGVNLPNLEDNDSVVSGDSSLPCSPTEISYVVKQLLMKYLPDDQLAKIATTSSKPIVNSKHQTNLIKPRPEFSMATVQYMEKYNLLNKEPDINQRTKKVAQKMLDITALKQQPKLL